MPDTAVVIARRGSSAAAAIEGDKPATVFAPERLPMGVVDPLDYVSRLSTLTPEQRAAATASAKIYTDLRKDERAAVAIALRAAGAKVGRIAQILRCSVHTVRDYLAAGREWGVLDDVVRDIDFRHVPRAVENLGKLLDAGDKETTLEVLKGRGIFRTFGNTKQEGNAATSMNLNVAFVNAPMNPTPGAIVVVANSTGEIVGAPNE